MHSSISYVAIKIIALQAIRTWTTSRFDVKTVVFTEKMFENKLIGI